MRLIPRRGFVQGILATGTLSLLPRPVKAAGRSAQTSGQPRILVFDVNETLLDIAALGPKFAALFGSPAVLSEWFSTVLLYSQVTTIAGPYADFGSVARASLQMTAAAHGVVLAKTDEDEVISGLVSLPAHPDVRDGLEKLRKAGFRMVTLTNSAPAAVERQLKSAGIDEYFERRLSVDAVRKFKPAPEVYRLVASDLAVEPSRLRLIAAHAWDVHGALRAGFAAAFVARPGKVLYPLGEKPDLAGPDLRIIADEIIKKDVPR